MSYATSLLFALALIACGDKDDADTTAGSDLDGDGFSQAEDCDDSDALVYPDAEELCDGIDNNCDGAIDNGASDAATWYLDVDGDGYGALSGYVTSCETQEGRVTVGGDCDDSDDRFNPGAVESCDDPTDYNCDGSVAYADMDGDGVAACNDCDDTDGEIRPGAVELCDGVDNDCDGFRDEDDAADAATWYADGDGDGYGDEAISAASCDQPVGYVDNSGDCDDATGATFPGADEYCDSIDNNCDGDIDEAYSVDALTWYRDLDGDGYGDPEASTAACSQPEGYVADSTDCDDGASVIFPGADESCDGLDNDCDGVVDPDSAVDAPTWYADADGDGWGVFNDEVVSCEAPEGYVADGGAFDCDDADTLVNPDAVEVCDAIDNDCDGDVDPDSSADALTWYYDGDGDGWGDEELATLACSAPEGYVAAGEPGDDGILFDCDDSDGDISPGADEYCDSIDNNCDGEVDEDSAVDALTWYLDQDNDRWGSALSVAYACEELEGYVAESGDCDDYSVDANPDEVELCDGIDNNCDGAKDEATAADASQWYADLDGDGYGDPDNPTFACRQPDDYVADATDCDDSAATSFPGADEYCDGIDNNCDGEIDEDGAVDMLSWYYDLDLDGYGDEDSVVLACEAPEGLTGVGGDCDDADGDISPGADEYCDAIDNNCDGEIDEFSAVDAVTWYFDGDGDGHGVETFTTPACDQPEGYAPAADDCDDDEAAAWTGATEICDGVDNNCNGAVDTDATDLLSWYVDSDGDGYGDAGVVEITCEQPEGYVADATDCDDAEPAAFPGADEYCDSIDNNCDGDIDEDGAVDALAWYYDLDLDGYGDEGSLMFTCDPPEGTVGVGGDCDDADDGVSPAQDEYCDAIDNNCDGEIDEFSAVDAVTWYFDGDGDGHGVETFTTPACDQPEGYAPAADDCDDDEAAAWTGATEICDGVDNNCNGAVDTDATDLLSWYVDSDGDGYGDALGTADYYSCEQQDGYAANNEDCDDSDDATNPDGVEVCEDGVDNDCDGTPNDCALSGTISLADADTRVVGAGVDSFLGYSVAGVGDVDGDGADDFLVGAYNAAAGEAWLYLGTPGGDAGADEADAVLFGESEDDFAGWSVAGAGDVDGDGYADLIIGAYGDDDRSENSGAAYLVLGPVTGDLDLASADAKLIGDEKYERVGWSVDGAGDVNGDGYADLLIGANGNDTGASNGGLTYLVYGPVSGEFDLAGADGHFAGENSSDVSGSAVSGAGDVDGDGYDDVIIGAYELDDGGDVAGGAYLVLGGTTGAVSLAAADATFIGEEAGDRAGWSVDSAGDMDGDGYADLIIGAYGYDVDGTSNAGAAYVVYGPVSGEVDLSEAEGRVLGESVNDYLGISVAGAGDVNGDGAGDLLVGGHGEDDGGSASGAAWLFTGPVEGDLYVDDARVKLTGEANSDYAGWSVSAGDMDGDDNIDLLVGAYQSDAGDAEAGSAYLILGTGL
jgi:hypothetical protein